MSSDPLSTVLVPLSVAVFAFLLMRFFFKFIAWFYPELDKATRAKLDEIFLLMHGRTFFAIGHFFFFRLDIRLSKLFERRRNYLTLALLFFALNAAVIYSSFFVLCTYHIYADWTDGDTTMWEYIARFGWHNLTALLMMGVLGGSFDLLSFWISRRLIAHAARVRSVRRILTTILCDLFAAALACCWGLLVVVVILGTLEPSMRTVMDNPDRYLGDHFLHTLEVNPQLWWTIVASGVSCAIPTIAYFFLGSLLLLARACPSFIYRFLTRLVFQVTTDGSPVFKLLGDAASVVSALVAGTVALVKAILT